MGDVLKVGQYHFKQTRISLTETKYNITNNYSLHFVHNLDSNNN